VKTAPNILLITSDQQHYSTMGAVNDLIHTPALERLCREGARFDRAYCPNPTCTPTRASIITGLMPSQHGAWSLGTKLMEDVPTLGGYLSGLGYETSLVGKAHFQPTLSTDRYKSLESEGVIRDLAFWKDFHGPWYGFDHIEILRNHGAAWNCGQHYALWMEERGLSNWRDYFPDQRGDKTAARRKGYYDQPRRRWALPAEFHYNEFISQRVIERLEHAGRSGKPFFCWASFPDPHPPYMVPEPWCDRYDPQQMPVGQLVPGEHENNPAPFGLTQQDNANEAMGELFRGDGLVHGAHAHLLPRDEVQRNIACYYGMVSFMDEHIGRILEAMDRLGQARDTLVVFTTDHGHFLGQHGLYAKAIHHYEDLLRVPMVVRWPGRVSAATVNDDLQNLVDLAPSFLSAAGGEIPFHMTGKDATGNWCGGPAAREYSITENHHGYRKAFLHTYVDKRYKITVYRAWDDGELFDLEQDPDELHNLWNDPASENLKRDLLLKFHQARMDSEQMRMPRIAGA
jgi:arylsulfatase A-like enzyme